MSDHEADRAPERKKPEHQPRTLKGMPDDDWKLIKDAADNAREPVAAYLARVTRETIHRQRQEVLGMTGGLTGEILPGNGLAPAGSTAGQPWSAPPNSLVEVMEALRLLQGLTGVQPPPAIIRQVHTLARRRLRGLIAQADRGAGPVMPRG